MLLNPYKFEGKTILLEQASFSFPYTPDMTVQAAYLQLKTLSEFADAVDVLMRPMIMFNNITTLVCQSP